MRNGWWHSFLMYFGYPSFILFAYAILARYMELNPQLFGKTAFLIGMLWFSYALLDSILIDKGIW